MGNQKIELSEVISNQRREDMLVGALEGGSNYWCSLEENACGIINRYSIKGKPENSVTEKMWRAILAGETIPIHDNEDWDNKLGEINLESIKKGEQLMFEQSPEHLADIISENDDAITADVWFQYCVLGSIVYG